MCVSCAGTAETEARAPINVLKLLTDRCQWGRQFAQSVGFILPQSLRGRQGEAFRPLRATGSAQETLAKGLVPQWTLLTSDKERGHDSLLPTRLKTMSSAEKQLVWIVGLVLYFDAICRFEFWQLQFIRASNVSAYGKCGGEAKKKPVPALSHHWHSRATDHRSTTGSATSESAWTRTQPAVLFATLIGHEESELTGEVFAWTGGVMFVMFSAAPWH
ncbi:hypothetical protein BU15DRAFT_58928 [Melanogaster broomeanus]|nr:hypothetical protein BU15DRAFT_58928 [Melanogaster broomeanus]